MSNMTVIQLVVFIFASGLLYCAEDHMRKIDQMIFIFLAVASGFYLIVACIRDIIHRFLGA